ncbi:3-methylcrotonyl-CoA carboxylase alpha subunit [Bradyrhizobium diazoefficiens]|uniref:3-methylcrotonyl-CoA carboxylase alpha subunit n=1 Tax=Bradyrhizobium diazoefficiens TaxID=1355477 RepID=A0A0E4BP26_9BRAD|nr:3-methylcrotonyl-CoA carboxylase alpha subunit [Bradyrhizobium diazoefficiens]
MPVKQQDIRFAGHAIEVRLCSEDAAQDFMPQSGRMARWQAPDGIRVEHALQSGSEIPPFYDSMIAKVISHGATREEARGRLIVGLEQLTAFGVTTNQAFLMSCLRHPGFARGEATTAFIGAHRDELLAPRRTRRSARRWQACCSTSQIRARRHGGAAGACRQRFRFLRKSRSPARRANSKLRESGMVGTPSPPTAGRTSSKLISSILTRSASVTTA